MRSNGDALDCREVGIVGETKDEELLRAATNCGTECMAEGRRTEEEELSWKGPEGLAKGDSSRIG